jgi:hypothetical protein
MEPWRPPGPRSFYPGRTLRTLHLAAIARFRSGVVLLHRPFLAHTVSDHVRALIELFAHGAWITSSRNLKAPMTSRSRSICVELGMAKALVDELEFLESTLGIPFPPGYISDKRTLVRHFSRMHANHTCACRGNGRSFRDVRGTLRALVELDPGLGLGSAKMLYGLWVTFSRAVHFPRLEHIAANAPGGAALEPATIRDRTLMLHNLVMVESSIAGFAATPFPTNKREIASAAHVLLRDIEARTHAPDRRS